MRLKDQVILITGAARGIGLVYAQRCVDEGANVIIADIDVGHADQPTSPHPDILFVRTDITQPEQTDRLVSEAVKRFSRLDCLINNAALFTALRRRPLEELTAEDWQQVLWVNVIGAFNCIKSAVPVMKKAKKGKIINIASNVVHKGLPYLLAYVASKGAIVAMTRALARELGPDGINVNGIAPGYVLHEGTGPTDAGRNEQVARLRSLGRTEMPDDLCGAMVFLASADSDFVTGQTLVVDGGEIFA
ncbi:MAG: SDR family oxidoreductase [Planctomycetes bacterium]|nr:SDR family oxidoreductase [Planctomycetota bacterium]